MIRPATHRRLPGTTTALALIVAASAVAACGGVGDGPPADGTRTTTAGPPPATAAAADGASPHGSPSDTAGPPDVAVAGTVSPTAGGVDRDDVATLLAVRAAARPESSAERVVFEFDGDAVPRYEIAYARPPLSQCGSGRTLTVAGGAALRVRLHATRAHAESGEEILPTVTERDRMIDQPLLRQLTLTCDFEGEVEWLLGVSERRPYVVRELRSPARLVVDLSTGR